MSKIGLIFIFVLMAFGSYGQQDHFVLIQADNDQPFYAHIREQSFSSSPQGHLILSLLKDSVYLIRIGFPKKQFPEEDFYFVIDKNDLGFQLKNQEGKGWVLVNMQTQEIGMPVRKDTIENKRLEGVKKDDVFSRLMAAVVSDTAVMYNSYVSTASGMDSSGGTSDSSAWKTKPFTPKQDANVGKMDNLTGSAIEKISEQKTRTTLRLIYTEHAKGYKSDTIVAIIALDSILPHQDTPPDTPKTGAGPSLISTAMPPANDSLKSLATAHSTRQEKTKPLVLNSDCRNYASDDDADKLKLKLQAIPTDDAKITVAKKTLKIKCFSTNQLNNITEIFASEEAKYKFLETAYPFVSDDHFRELSALFTDPLYIAKFKTLTGANGQ